MTEQEIFQEFDRMSDEIRAEEAPRPAFTPPVRKLAIYYDFVRRDGSQGKNRFFLDWAADLRIANDLVSLEKMLVDGSNGELISALITDWRPLEG